MKRVDETVDLLLFLLGELGFDAEFLSEALHQFIAVEDAEIDVLNKSL